MFEDYTELVTKSEYTTDLLDDITQSVFEIEMNALEANSTATEAWQSFSERVTILNDIEDISLDCSSELTETRNSVNDLRWKLLEAQRAAASVSSCVIYLSIYLSIRLSIYLLIYSSIYLSIHPFMDPSIHLSIIYLSIYPSIHLSIYLYIYIFSLYPPLHYYNHRLM